MTRSIFSKWVQKPLLLLAAMIAYQNIYGQSNFITIFGNNGCSGPLTDGIDLRLNCSSTPTTSTLSSIHFTADYAANGWGTPGLPLRTNQFLYNSQYDATGNLLSTQ